MLNNSATIQIDEKLKGVLGEDWRFWKDFSHQEVRDRFEKLSIEKFLELRKTLENNFHLIIKSIKNEFQPRNYRDMFSNILSLVDILIPDFLKSGQFIEAWQLTNLNKTLSISQREEATLKKLRDLLEVYSWLYPRYVWILALDDLDHLDNINIQQKLFDLLKIFRNKTNNICVMLTATIDQWDYFDESIKGTDKLKQLKGIFTQDECYFDLDYLPDEEMLDWVGRVVQRWWDRFNIKLPHDGRWYPFSRNAIEFIINYEPNDKTPRSVGNRLVDLWDKLKNAFSTTGKLFVESEFDAWKLMSPENYTKLNPFTQELLLSYRLKEKYGAFSGSIEDGIKEIIEILQASQEFRVVEIVEVKRNKEFNDDRFKTKSKKRRADVYIELQKLGGVDTTRIEIQVKAGDPNREITRDELESSFDLLEYNHIDFLIIVSFSELNSNTKKNLEKFRGRYNITATKLSSEQQAFCVLIAYFRNITSRKLTPLEAATSFQKIFGISPHLFFRSWLETKKEFIEKVHIFDIPTITPEITPEKKKTFTSTGSIESFIKPPKPIPPKLNEEKDKLLSTIKWMLKKGIERKPQWKNRITKTWLLKHKDCPVKEVLDKAWKKLLESEQYGKSEKSTFYIDVESSNALFN